MAGSTISDLVSMSVTLGTGLYSSPLTITPTGTIDGNPGGSAYGYGDGFGENGGSGGTALDARDGVVTNSGTIFGGGGGYGTHLGSGGSGGTGVLLDSGSHLSNMGLITGGGAGSAPGLYGKYYAAGGAGAAVANSTLTNSGTILGGVSGNGGEGGVGVNLTNGIVTNDGSIAGAYGGFSGGAGVAVRGGTLTNNSTITGGSGEAGGVGVSVAGRGILRNSGTISGGYGEFYGGIGVDITNSTLTNDGTITGSNGPNGLGGIGVLFHGGGTLNDAGFIGGGNGGTADAVEFGTAASRLILDPGASFSGSVVADAAFTNVLELATGDGRGTTAGTLSGLGTSFTNFGRVIIDTGASWELTGTNTLPAGTTLANNGTLTLFNAAFADAGTVVNDGGIVLDPSMMTVVGLTDTGSVTIEAGGMLEVQGTIAHGETLAFGGSSAHLQLDSPGSVAGSVKDFGFGETIDLKGVDPASVSYAGGRLTFIGGSFALSLAGASKISASTSGDGAAISVLCFRANTRILTPSGERPVQAFAVGDLVRTVLGEATAAIVWVGRREVECVRHPQPRKVWPVRVAAEAFGPGRPHADLFLSPDHAIYVEGVLIPVKYLINGSTVAQVPVDRVTYHHLELAEQDVLLAEGLPAESYLDMRDGSDYANRSGPDRLYPDYAARMWEAFGCAPLIVTGPKLAAARALVENFASKQAAA